MDTLIPQGWSLNDPFKKQALLSSQNGWIAASISAWSASQILNMGSANIQVMSGRLKLQAVVYSTGSYWLLRDDSNIGLIQPCPTQLLLKTLYWLGTANQKSPLKRVIKGRGTGNWLNSLYATEMCFSAFFITSFMRGNTGTILYGRKELKDYSIP